MMYIAEVAGLKREVLKKAYDFLYDFETKKGIKGNSTKGGGYLNKYNDEDVLSHFRDEILHMDLINDIIKEEETYKNILERVGKIA